MTQRHAAVAGSPIAHSLSPVLHEAAYESLGLDISYGRREAQVEDIPALLADIDSSWVGISCTMPLKQALAPHLDFVDGLARTVGSINTIAVQPNKHRPLLAGFNTDVEGIVRAIREVAAQPASMTAAPWTATSGLILGSRATASSAVAALIQLGAKESLTIAARNHGGPGSALSAATRMNVSASTASLDPVTVSALMCERAVTVSTLPAGVSDSIAVALHDRVAGTDHLAGRILLDVVYHPWPSPLVSAWESGGGTVAPGWLMLAHQAVGQVRLFTSQTPDISVMLNALHRELAQRA